MLAKELETKIIDSSQAQGVDAAELAQNAGIPWLLTGQVKPTKGILKVLGLDVLSNPLKVRELVGIIPEQETPPSFLTGEEYLYFVASIRGLKNAEKRIKELSLFPETNPDIVLKLDSNGKVLYMNPATQNMMDTLSIDFKEVLPKNVLKKIKTVIKTGTPLTGDEKQIKGVYMDYTYALFPDKQSVLLRGKDITTTKEMEHQLGEYSRHLETLVKEKTDILKVLYDLEYLLKEVSLEEGLNIIKKSVEKLGFDQFELLLLDEEQKLKHLDGTPPIDDAGGCVLKKREPVIDKTAGLAAWYPLVYLEKGGA